MIFCEVSINEVVSNILLRAILNEGTSRLTDLSLLTLGVSLHYNVFNTNINGLRSCLTHLLVGYNYERSTEGNIYLRLNNRCLLTVRLNRSTITCCLRLSVMPLTNFGLT